jgi:hypothetical protein
MRLFNRWEAAAVISLLPVLVAAQNQAAKSPAIAEPSLPVIDLNACPFEGCSFRKWIVLSETQMYSTWKNEGRKNVVTLAKGQIVTGLTGVHLTFEPDRIRVLKAMPELRVQPGDIILRYMYQGEGFADIWVNGEWKKSYDCSFVTEEDDSGCLRNCSARVISEGRKEWWVRIQTAGGITGWSLAGDQFDCMDSLGAEPQCGKL